MSIPKSTSTYTKKHWEDSEFPIICQTCLGPNPYVRMLKDKFGSECKVCQRPFTNFKWLPGPRMRYKKTEICQMCAKLKNVCQTCLFDLEYGLPTQVRDHVLNITEKTPQGDVNKEYYRDTIEKQLVGTDGTQAVGAMVNKVHSNNEVLKRLARNHPYYERNRPHLCSFWVKGECKRGEECPFRHEMPTDPNDPMSSQNIRDRYHGVDDPVAAKLFKKMAEMPALDRPVDKSITTLYVGGIDKTVSEKDLVDYFYQFGEIRNISVHHAHACAFITFTNRVSAELAADGSHNSLSINGLKLKIDWARPQGINEPGKPGGVRLVPVPNIPQEFPYPLPEEEPKIEPLPQSSPSKKKGVHYPSQDPYRLGKSTQAESKKKV